MNTSTDSENLASTKLLVFMLTLVVVLLTAGGAVGLLVASRLNVTPADVFTEVQKLGVQEAVLESVRRELEQSQAATAMMGDVLETSDEPIAALDERGIVVIWSPGAEEMFGVSKANSIGYGIGWMMPATMKTEHKRAFGEAIESTRHKWPKAIECDALDAHGQPLAITIKLWVTPDKMAIARFTKREAA